MKLYYALLKGSGGCDYTMACNQTWVDFMAEDLEDAKSVVKNRYWPYYTSQGEKADDVLIIEANQVYVADVILWRAELREEERRRKEQEIKVKELKELSRLKAKYEKS